MRRTSVAELKKLLATASRNDAVLAQLYIDGRRNSRVEKRLVSDPTDRSSPASSTVKVSVR